MLCESCSGEMKFMDTRWVKFMMEDDEEIVFVYECQDCHEEQMVRQEDRSHDD